MRTLSPNVQPWIIALWPIVQFLPIVTLTPTSVWTTVFSGGEEIIRMEGMRGERWEVERILGWEWAELIVLGISLIKQERSLKRMGKMMKKHTLKVRIIPNRNRIIVTTDTNIIQNKCIFTQSDIANNGSSGADIRTRHHFGNFVLMLKKIWGLGWDGGTSGEWSWICCIIIIVTFFCAFYLSFWFFLNHSFGWSFRSKLLVHLILMNYYQRFEWEVERTGSEIKVRKGGLFEEVNSCEICCW